MRIRQLGESCLIMKELPCPPAELAHILNQSPPPGLLEAVPAFDQLALYFDPAATDSKTLLSQSNIQEMMIIKGGLGTPPPPRGGIKGGVEENDFNQVSPSPSLGSGRGGVDESTQSDFNSPLPKPAPAKAGENGLRKGNDQDINKSSTHHQIPAVYSAPDLTEVAQTLNLTVEQIIQLHSQATYTVEAIGFCPGFPYLSGLPPELQNLPRRPTPRTKVEPGTIAITGDQCCIYPLERPGGWNLIAHTPFIIVNPEADYFPLQVGDTIHFQPIDENQFNQLVGNKL